MSSKLIKRLYKLIPFFVFMTLSNPTMSGVFYDWVEEENQGVTGFVEITEASFNGRFINCQACPEGNPIISYSFSFPTGEVWSYAPGQQLTSWRTHISPDGTLMIGGVNVNGPAIQGDRHSEFPRILRMFTLGNGEWTWNIQRGLPSDPDVSGRGRWVLRNNTPVISCPGFDSPMANGPVTVKKNRVLPHKAVLFDDIGNPIIDLDIASPPVIQVIFNSVIGEPPVDVSDEALSVGAGTDGNQFEYDPSTEKWQFNLKTKNYEAPGTYTITMQSGDDTEYVISPTCTSTFVVE